MSRGLDAGHPTSPGTTGSLKRAGGRVWCWPYGERRTVELETAA